MKPVNKLFTVWFIIITTTIVGLFQFSYMLYNFIITAEKRSIENRLFIENNTKFIRELQKEIEENKK